MEKISTLSAPEPENKCLGSLFLKLEAIVVNPVAGQQPQQIKLYLTIQFKEQRELLVGGHIKFGLKGGKLRVKLKNAAIPATSDQLGRSYELAVHKKPPLASIPQNSEIPVNLPSQTNELQLISCKVAVRGTPTRPVWIFQVDKDGSVLKGVLKNTSLATLDITEKPCYIEATFEVAPRDIHLSEAEGLWPKNISKKKSVVIERAIIRRFLELKLSPYLSRQIMRYD
ncbi:MAG: hypothetical protein WBG73_14315 [Coleofasciculaceae cyanobacterium]